MKLRKLEEKDARLMLEWMHDESVVRFLGANFSEKNIQDCVEFIQKAGSYDTDMHLAVVDDADIYMGTVSLKHIDHEAGNAEFAISMRNAAMGKGFAHFGMDEILRLGHEMLGLKHIFWCVSVRNVRAVRFYDKNGYQRVASDAVPISVRERYTDEQQADFLWYGKDFQ
ncbi:MAG: GNAT family N-acetyltransferase [Lachnospiraceae bacterium]|nr:GNAT family N-acetyltransferase [Lachnospiraceae bacterium]